MSKRRAERQLTDRDDPDADELGQDTVRHHFCLFFIHSFIKSCKLLKVKVEETGGLVF